MKKLKLTPPSRSLGLSYQQRYNRRKQLLSWGLRLLYWVSLAVALLVILGSILIFLVSQGLPKIDTITTYIPNESTQIFASDGTEIGALHREENRELIPLEKISPHIQKTVIAVEDTDFYSHHGINIKGIFRALIRDVFTLSFAEGGSTLTQQLARNLFLTKHKSILRKVKEMILATQMEKKFTKNELLEMYLNQVYWGHNAYGIESASQLYFAKHASRLSLPEAALLVGLLKGPEYFSPYRNFEAAKARQKVVLGRMRALKLITKTQAEQAYQQPLLLAPKQLFRFKVPYFTSYIVEKLNQLYGDDAVLTSGMKIYTTVDYKLQLAATDIMKKYLGKGKKPWTTDMAVSQGAIMVIEPQTGCVRVMQGGADFGESQFNRCVQSKRQPGSSFKPFVYLAALEKGYTPATIVDDSPISFDLGTSTYTPQNYTHKFLGAIPLRKALEQSVNIVAIKLTKFVGPNNVVRVAHELGIKSDLKPVLSLPLGANEVTMMELATAYSTLANGGLRVEPTCITRIEDRNGIPLYQYHPTPKRVADPNRVYDLVTMMKGVVDYGTGKAAKLPRPVAGKTGTTSDYRDAWFVGFVPQLVCATWVGNDNNSPMKKVTGGSLPAILWREMMKYALEDVPPKDFQPPKWGLALPPVLTAATENFRSSEDAVYISELPQNIPPSEDETLTPNAEIQSQPDFFSTR